VPKVEHDTAIDSAGAIDDLPGGLEVADSENGNELEIAAQAFTPGSPA
jgi:hypothetical protein